MRHRAGIDLAVIAALLVAAMAVLLMALLAAAPRARAHEAYDYRCCGQNDCAPVADAAVHEAGDVVIFRIAPGTHPMWGADKAAHLVVEIERFRIERRTLDGRWHLCLNSAQFPLCAYPPGRSF
jgi:predicted lysophospholipase L1 biosynthesis ABC-type transport system permease subunit